MDDKSEAFKCTGEQARLALVITAKKLAEQARDYLTKANCVLPVKEDDILDSCIDAAGIKLEGAIVDMQDYIGLVQSKDLWEPKEGE